MSKCALLLAVLSLSLVSVPVLQAQENPAGCVAPVDPGLSVFADQVEVEEATGFTVEYGPTYKVVTVTEPWVGAEPLTYLLVQCGTAAPEDITADAVIEVPVQTAVSMSTTYLPHFVELGLLDHLVAVDELDFIYSPAVRERIDAGEIVEVGGSSFVDVEALLDLDPDVVFTYGTGSADYDAHPILLAAGIPTVLNGDYMETTPLGRAEWVKFTSLFFNAEAEANALFDGIQADYTDLTDLAAAQENPPAVLVNALYGDTWFVSGGNSYMARLIADAGGAYLWADDESTGGLPLSFEDVLERGAEADVWLNPNAWHTLADGLAEDERYASFAAFESGRVYNNNARTTELGGNDALETGVLHPEQMLADLIAIFHPAVLPDHEFSFYRQLP